MLDFIFKNIKTFEDIKILDVFTKRFEGIGVKLGAYSYIAKQYKGPPKNAKYQLCLKDGIFSEKILILDENKKHLETLYDYIKNNPRCKDWKLFIRSREMKISTGNYAIIQETKCTGITEKNSGVIKNIVKEFGGNEDDINYILYGAEEEILGYFPWKDFKTAQEYANIIDVGAKIPISAEELLSDFKNWKRIAEYKAERGDKTSKDLAVAFDTLVNIWRNKVKREKEIMSLESKYIQKYKELVGVDYVLKLLKEYKEQKISFEPIRKLFSNEVIDRIYTIIDNFESLTPQNRIEAIFGFMSFLDGSIPSEESQRHLEKSLGPEFIPVLNKMKKALKQK